MWCLQKTIEFISYFGFVFIALEGQNFCQACKNTFAFLLEPKNAAQAAVNKTVEKLIVLIISWTTPTLMSLVCYGWLFNDAEYMTDHVNNPLYPAILVWIGSFFIADAIATVFECTIDTIFLCSFQDSKEYGGKYMSPDMREAFGLDVAEQEAAPIQSALSPCARPEPPPRTPRKPRASRPLRAARRSFQGLQGEGGGGAEEERGDCGGRPPAGGCLIAGKACGRMLCRGRCSIYNVVKRFKLTEMPDMYLLTGDQRQYYRGSGGA